MRYDLPVLATAAASSPPLRSRAESRVRDLVRADERLKTGGFATITLPVLIVHGTADEVTLARGSERFAEQGGSVDKTLKLYPDHAHDLLNDVGREVVMADMIEWIATRIPKR